MLGLGNLGRMVFGSANDRRLKRYQPLVAEINGLEPEIAALSDAELRARTDIFRKQVAEGTDLDDILPQAFATVREAAKRTLGQRHFDVQLVGGMVLHEGSIAEMRTGEGKTLVATLPVYLNALAGKGVHVVTVNDYLARRDAEWMGRIYQFLGLSVGVIVHGLNSDERRQAYAADVTYGTNNEFGFDYLRDNMEYNLQNMVQRGHYYAIVDEVDFDPGRRGAHAPHHFRSDRGSLRALHQDRRSHPSTRHERLRTRREATHRQLHRGGHGKDRTDARCARPLQGRVAL